MTIDSCSAPSGLVHHHHHHVLPTYLALGTCTVYTSTHAPTLAHTLFRTHSSTLTHTPPDHPLDLSTHLKTGLRACALSLPSVLLPRLLLAACPPPGPDGLTAVFCCIHAHPPPVPSCGRNTPFPRYPRDTLLVRFPDRFPVCTPGHPPDCLPGGALDVAFSHTPRDTRQTRPGSKPCLHGWLAPWLILAPSPSPPVPAINAASSPVSPRSLPRTHSPHPLPLDCPSSLLLGS